MKIKIKLGTMVQNNSSLCDSSINWSTFVVNPVVIILNPTIVIIKIKIVIV